MKTKFAAEANASKEINKNARHIAGILLNQLSQKTYDAEAFEALRLATIRKHITEALHEQGHFDAVALNVTELVLSGAVFSKLKTPLSVISQVLTGDDDTSVFEVSEEKPVKPKGKKAVAVEEDEPVKTKKSKKKVEAEDEEDEEESDAEDDSEIQNESGGKPGRPSKHLRSGFSKMWSEMTAEERRVFVKAFNIGDSGYRAVYSKKDGKVPKAFSAENARDDSSVACITVSVGKTLRIAFLPIDSSPDDLRLTVELPSIRCERE